MSGIASETDQSVLGSPYSLAVLLPALAVPVRRLHDTGRSGWWLLIGLVSIVGAIVHLLFLVEDSHAGDNMYRPIPRE